MPLDIDRASTALVVIDLQWGIAATGRPTAPHSVETVVANAAERARAFRAHRMPVCLVRVAASPEERLAPSADDAGWRPSARSAPDAAEFVPEIRPEPSDLVVTKRQWGAFYGTDLELRLRRRGIRTIFLCGIATNYGVESTARFACEYEFQQIFAEDAMTSLTSEMHRASVEYVLKRIGRVRSTREILPALGSRTE